jgi:hypothetical protein
LQVNEDLSVCLLEGSCPLTILLLVHPSINFVVHGPQAPQQRLLRVKSSSHLHSTENSSGDLMLVSLLDVDIISYSQHFVKQKSQSCADKKTHVCKAANWKR